MRSVLCRVVFVGVSSMVVAACVDGAVSPQADTPVVTAPAAPATVDGRDPSPPRAVPPDGVEPEGFTTITARITDADGEVCDVCVWLADTVEERRRGLMEVTDLGDAAGMVFRFEQPVVNSFFMLNTPTPLSIAWFSPNGEFAAATDMEPCLDDPDQGCPLYNPGVEYELALEVFRGGLGELGVGPGARLELLDGTEADRCPAGS